mmetsp:Transcript_1932/g.5346  ORF Transcript_1932/g.5346 Transcript_1932/m.5346 type:complete len:119 (-) Transcript_1932:148-504(-)
MKRKMDFVRVGALSAAGAVAMGAFGAHYLKNITTEKYYLEVFDTASKYHLFHSIALCFCGLDSRASVYAPWLFLAGTALFSGSLYLLVLTGVRKLGAITPIGGVLLIAGWCSMALQRR